jgi:hypothetical protein
VNFKAIGIAAMLVALPLWIGIFLSWLQYPDDFSNRKKWRVNELKIDSKPDKASTRFFLWIFVFLAQLFLVFAIFFLILGGIYE